MGIKKLNSFLNKKNLYKNYTYLTDLINDLNIDKNKLFIGIDGNLFCYKYTYSFDNMLIGFYNQIVKFISHGYYPFYIFDGGTLMEKEYTLLNRNKKKISTRNKIDKIDKIINESNNNIHDNEFQELLSLKKKMEKNTIKISFTQIKKVIDLLNLLNIPYLFSHGEGEYLAVLLNKYNIIDIFLSDDTDPIPAGINKIMKFTNNCVSFLDVNNCLSSLNITQKQLCDFSILLGTDYNNFYHELKPEQIFQLINSYPIEDIINLTKFNSIDKNNDFTNMNDDDKKNFILQSIYKIRNIYVSSPNYERLMLIDKSNVISNYNVISNCNKSLEIFSDTVFEFFDELLDVLKKPLENLTITDNINILNLKENMIKYIKKKKYSIKNITSFIKINIPDINCDELNNIINTFTYLNTFN